MSITITQMIAHEMKITKDSPALAPHVINLNTVPTAVFDFFTNHIETSRNARQVKACAYVAENTKVQTSVKEIYNNLSDSNKFVSITQELTLDLITKAKSAGSRSDGALFFLLYKHNGEDFLGIMKMDPNDGIQINTQNFTLDVRENMLPNPKDKLHKCAFIKNINDFNNQVHLYVLDRQQNKGEVSKYFLSTFLDAREITNDKIMTERVVKKLNESYNEIVPKPKSLNFQLSMDKMFTNGKSIDLDLDLEKLITPFVEEDAIRHEYIERFKRELREEYEDAYFQFNAEKDPTIIQYSSNQIKIEFPIEFLDTYIFVDETDNNFTLRITDIPLNKKEK